MNLMHGDCLELMKGIPDHSVDMVLCDLPYGSTDFGWDVQIDSKVLWGQYKRICKQNANVVLFCDMRLANVLIESTFNSEFSHSLIWCKRTKTRHLSVNSLPMSQHEMILVFRINKYSNKQQHKRLREYFTSELKKSGRSVREIEMLIPNRSAHHWFRFSSDFRIPTAQNYKRLQEITGYFDEPYEKVKTEFLHEKKNIATYNGKNESDLLYFELTEERMHNTQKPVAMLEYLIRIYSNEGETVLDNCMGSGSTGVACKNTNRRFIGIEIDDHYFEVARNRIL